MKKKMSFTARILDRLDDSKKFKEELLRNSSTRKRIKDFESKMAKKNFKNAPKFNFGYGGVGGSKSICPDCKGVGLKQNYDIVFKSLWKKRNKGRVPYEECFTCNESGVVY